MLMLPPSVRIFLAADPVDCRGSFDALAAQAQQVLRQEPQSGHLFVFRNRRGDRVKILWWDRGGFCIWYKRLEEGTFRFPPSDAGSHEVEASELAMLLEGIDLQQTRQRKRYRAPVSNPVR